MLTNSAIVRCTVTAAVWGFAVWNNLSPVCSWR